MSQQWSADSRKADRLVDMQGVPCADALLAPTCATSSASSAFTETSEECRHLLSASIWFFASPRKIAVSVLEVLFDLGHSLGHLVAHEVNLERHEIHAEPVAECDQTIDFLDFLDVVVGVGEVPSEGHEAALEIGPLPEREDLGLELAQRHQLVPLIDPVQAGEDAPFARSAISRVGRPTARSACTRATGSAALLTKRSSHEELSSSRRSSNHGSSEPRPGSLAISSTTKISREHDLLGVRESCAG